MRSGYRQCWRQNRPALPTGAGANIRDVERFIEKPSREKAEEFLACDRFMWNAGIFLFSGKCLIQAFENHAPETLAACGAAIDRSVSDTDYLRLDKAAYETAENILSIILSLCTAGCHGTGLLSLTWSRVDFDEGLIGHKEPETRSQMDKGGGKGRA